MKKASHFHVNESDLLCKNRCGFYGNTLWMGYCSVCYKSVSGKQKPSPQFTSASYSTPTLFGTQGIPNLQNFSKFEDKRKQQQDKKSSTVKSFFSKKSPKARQSSPLNQSQEKAAAVINNHGENRSRSESITRLTETIPNCNPEMYSTVSKKVSAFLQKFRGLPPTSSLDTLSEEVQDFFTITCDAIAKEYNLEEKDANLLIDFLEVHIMTRLYPATFCPNYSNDERLDLILHKRIKSLHWVTIQQLEAGVSLDDLGVRAALDKSISDLIELDTKRSPKEKLTCIVNCSKGIFQALKLSRDLTAMKGEASYSSVASADDFLPVFIFIILKANPPRLKSNINYITRFACPSRLNSGEEGYFFTNMCCVVDFVEKLNPETLNLTQEQCNSYMDGEAVPDGTNTVYMCEGLRLMHDNKEMILKLKERQFLCTNSIHELKQRISQYKKEFDEENNNIIQNTPLTLKACRTKANVDTEYELPDSLPLPLLPEPVNKISQTN